MTHRTCRLLRCSLDGLAEQVTISPFDPAAFVFFEEFDVFPVTVFVLSYLDGDDRRRSCAGLVFLTNDKLIARTTVLFGNDRYVPVVFPSPTIDM